eukprot:gene31316-39358_t
MDNSGSLRGLFATLKRTFGTSEEANFLPDTMENRSMNTALQDQGREDNTSRVSPIQANAVQTDSSKGPLRKRSKALAPTKLDDVEELKTIGLGAFGLVKL